jgi:hypothetical protein
MSNIPIAVSKVNYAPVNACGVSPEKSRPCIFYEGAPRAMTPMQPSPVFTTQNAQTNGKYNSGNAGLVSPLKYTSSPSNAMPPPPNQFASKVIQNGQLVNGRQQEHNRNPSDAERGGRQYQ